MKKRFFLKGKEIKIEDIVDVFETQTVNDKNAFDFIKEKKPDVLIDFGTRKVSPHIIDICPDSIINLHGGDPEKYRGLDSHLWAIYHNDFESLVTSLHLLNVELDDGHVILQAKLPLNKDVKFFMLRKVNTDICIELTLSALDMYKRYNRFISRPQRSKGRYYSFMPSCLKEICLKKYNYYINQKLST